jgi:P27 family predicted phage terminase small subunit
MAPRGQRPTPTRLKILRGNPGRRPLNEQEPTPAAGSLAAPTWLEGEAAAEWKRLAPVLHRLGLLTEIDETALATYCQAWARWREAERNIQKFGMVIKGKGGFPIISPFVAVANRAMSQMKGLLVEFGMTPSARSRVIASGDRDKPVDPFAEFDGMRLEQWEPPTGTKRSD